MRIYYITTFILLLLTIINSCSRQSKSKTYSGLEISELVRKSDDANNILLINVNFCPECHYHNILRLCRNNNNDLKIIFSVDEKIKNAYKNQIINNCDSNSYSFINENESKVYFEKNPTPSGMLLVKRYEDHFEMNPINSLDSLVARHGH